jgi:phytoene desaturase
MQSAYFRVHNRDRNIRGLYFVGAGTHPGAGIPGVVNSAKATANLILEDLKSVLASSAIRLTEVSYA